MDAALQQLFARWQATGAIDDGVRAAQARLRAGLLTIDGARLAATLGDPVALALGHAPLEGAPRDDPEPVWRDRTGVPSAPRIEFALSRAPARTSRALLADAALRQLSGCSADDLEVHGPVVRHLVDALRRGDEAAYRRAAGDVRWRVTHDVDWRDAIMDGSLEPQGGQAAAVIAAAAAHDAWARAVQVMLTEARSRAIGQLRGLKTMSRPEALAYVTTSMTRAFVTEQQWLERRLAGLLLWGTDALPPPEILREPAATSTGALTRAWRWLTGT